MPGKFSYLFVTFILPVQVGRIFLLVNKVKCLKVAICLERR